LSCDLGHFEIEACRIGKFGMLDIGWILGWMFERLDDWMLDELECTQDEEKRTLKYFRLALIKAGGIKHVDKEKLQK
jgi:hypothetical protein